MPIYRGSLVAGITLCLGLAGCSPGSDGGPEAGVAVATSSSLGPTDIAGPNGGSESSGSEERDSEERDSNGSRGGTKEVEPPNANDAGVLLLSGAPVPPDGAWQELQRPYFVFDVRADDRLNIRSGPGGSYEIIGSFSPAATGIILFDEVVLVGSRQDQTVWSPVVVLHGAGWIARRFVRPEPKSTIEFIGELNDDVLTEASVAAELLGSPASLAALVGSKGLRLSTDSYVDESDLVFDVTELQAGSNDVVRLGTQDGSGEPIMRSLREHFEYLGGLTALTSTEVVSVDLEIVGGNTINNVRSFYPEAVVVEYHFAGTEYYGGLDWSSVRFVFETDDDQVLRLIAIIEAQWTI